jgi:hypothetical protein
MWSTTFPCYGQNRRSREQGHPTTCRYSAQIAYWLEFKQTISVACIEHSLEHLNAILFEIGRYSHSIFAKILMLCNPYEP